MTTTKASGKVVSGATTTVEKTPKDDVHDIDDILVDAESGSDGDFEDNSDSGSTDVDDFPVLAHTHRPDSTLKPQSTKKPDSTLKPESTSKPESTPKAEPTHKACTNVSVATDATYCIEGPICSGSGILPTGFACPKAHDVAVADCQQDMRSYLKGDCVAPVDSVCWEIETGAWGCVWKDDPETPSKEATEYKECTDVSIAGDATYCIEGPVCSGSGSLPTGFACPKADDVAVAGCNQDLRSYSDNEQDCVAPVDSVCWEIHTGAWGCVWQDDPETPSATEATESKTCTDVSVEGDATFCISGDICTGTGSSPKGDRCPVSGDIAMSECEEGMPSYKNGKCVATTDSVCQRVKTGAWGCAWSGDSAASYLIDTNTNDSSTGSSSNAAMLGGIAAAAAAVVAIVGGVMWSRKRRNQQYRDSTAAQSGDGFESMATPPSSRGASFSRV